MADDLCSVPVISVSKNNLVSVWPSLIHAIDTACLIGVDVELSGLGDRKLLTLKNIEDRYTSLIETAKSRSILSLGIACFRPQRAENATKDDEMEPCSVSVTTSRSYVVQIFDVLLLCMDDYVVEPLSLQFLVNHGFDFNKQCSQGLPYNRGNDEEGKKCSDKPSVRNLFLHLVESKKKLALHNGFVDLVFLYQNLYAQLPTKLAVFLADIQEMFSEGIFDTKYVAEFCLHHKASYLEYLFKRMQRLNENHKTENRPQNHVQMQFLKFKSDFEGIDYDDLRSIKGKTKADLCFSFASHGWCPKPSQCTKSHDVDLVLDNEGITKTKRKKRKKAKELDGDMEVDVAESPETVAENEDDKKGSEGEIRLEAPIEGSNKRGSHRAGYDAFMTGYSLVIYFATIEPPVDIGLTSGVLESTSNRIYLCGKEQPLVIKKSNFTKTSQNHKLKKIKR